MTILIVRKCNEQGAGDYPSRMFLFINYSFIAKPFESASLM